MSKIKSGTWVDFLLDNCRDLEVIIYTDENKKINKKIQRFVDAMGGKGQSASYYSNKRNTYKEKALSDIFLGKKGEFIAEIGLRTRLGFPKIDIDLEIRKGRKKGWKYDLPYHDLENTLPNLHVKTCNQKTFDFCDDYSWTFQYSDRDSKSGGQDNIFSSSSNDYIAFVFLQDHLSNVGTIKCILSWKETQQYLRDPIKSILIGLKKCLYFNDIKGV